MSSLPTHLSSTCDSVKNNSLLNYHVEGPFVRVGNTNRPRQKGPFVRVGTTNRDKRVTLLSGLVLPTGIKGLGLLSRLEPPTGTKGGPFVRVGTSNRDKRPLSAPLARLAFRPGTKATYYPGPKGCRDKWPGTKACSVVVNRHLLNARI